MHFADILHALISRKYGICPIHILKKCPEFSWYILCCRMLKRGVEYAINMYYPIIIVQVADFVRTYIIAGKDSYDALRHCKQLRYKFRSGSY
jgi:hypothetical protein